MAIDEKDGILIPRTANTRLHIYLTNNIGKEWIAVSLEKMIRDKWIMAKCIQILPEEWAKIRELEIA